MGAAKLLTKFGVTDLAVLAADRAATIAVEADSLGARGMAVYQVVCAQLRGDHTEEAERLAVRMAETIHKSVTAETPTLVSVAGALWLIAAVAAARRTDRGEAWARLDAAERLAELLGEDANHAWTAFGPTNVRIHRVTVAAELGDPGEALRAAAEVDPARLAEGLRSRRAQVSLDPAWAQAQRKSDAAPARSATRRPGGDPIQRDGSRPAARDARPRPSPEQRPARPVGPRGRAGLGPACA